MICISRAVAGVGGSLGMDTAHIQPTGETGAGLLVGLDIGGTKKAVLLVDRALTVVGRGTAPTDVSSPQNLVDGIYRAVMDTLAASGSDDGRLLAIGAGVPGMVDPQTGLVQLAVNLNLESYPLGEALAARFGVPVALENDVNAAALGAFHWLNQQQKLDDMVYLSLGTGVAAGIILNGRLHRGKQGMAGEVGHIVFDPDGVRCACGLHGCLETIASGPAIARAYEGGDGTAQAVFAAARKGDVRAQAAVRRSAAATARAIQLLVMSFDVEKVVLGGGVLGAGEAFLDPLEEALDVMRKDSPVASRMLPANKIVAAPPAADVARWGAVLLALKALEFASAVS